MQSSIIITFVFADTEITNHNLSNLTSLNCLAFWPREKSLQRVCTYTVDLIGQLNLISNTKINMSIFFIHIEKGKER